MRQNTRKPPIGHIDFFDKINYVSVIEFEIIRPEK